MQALLALEDGVTFACRSFTGSGEVGGEAVFNTGMTGYQEILTDPSYRGQLVTMTYPQMGNYGVNLDDIESDSIQVSGFIVKEYHKKPSHFKATASLGDYLKDHSVMGIEDLDTRALTRHIRTKGALRAFISTRDLDPKSLADRARKIPTMAGRDLAGAVTTKTPFYWSSGKKKACDTGVNAFSPDLWRQRGKKFSVVALDFGIKYNILRCLEAAGCETLVVPATTPHEAVEALAPDGIFLSNGPGDPQPVTYAIETVRRLLEFRPIFGICLGIQLLGIALGGDTYKLKFGHRGANQPVQNLLTKKVEITSQNHGFAVKAESLDKKEIQITHLNLNDNTLEGFRHRRLPILAVQSHPEAAPGPHDARYLFDEFVRLMQEKKA